MQHLSFHPLQKTMQCSLKVFYLVCFTRSKQKLLLLFLNPKITIALFVIVSHYEIDCCNLTLLIAIAWRPIRLQCGHVFCVRCLIKAHKKRLYDCPVCRQAFAVGNADATNLDQALQNFMLLYFPREIKEKRNENEKEQAALNQKKRPKRIASTHLYQAPFPSNNIAARDHNCTIM